MSERPKSSDRLTVDKFHGWYTAAWVLLGLIPSVIGVENDSGAPKWGALALLAVLASCYTAVRRFPDNPVLRPQAYLALLALGLGAMGGLPGGGAALFIVSLPQFWLFATGVRASIVLSGAAAAATVVGSTLRGDESLTGNVVFIFIGYAASVLTGLLIHRLVADGDARAGMLGAELESAQARLAEAHRQQGAADERERMAREIHDTLAQGFASIIVLAEAARSTVTSDPERTGQQLVSIEQTARENFAEARVLVGSAPQSGLAPGSVAVTLRRTLDRFTQDTGLTVEAELPPDVACDQQTRIALLRCTQESLANVRKHAAATTVGVVLTQHPHAIELEITDDGRGFVVEDSRGFGLDGMRKRLAELDGDLTVTSSLGDGTRILATIHTNGQP
ncbi:sensor histidine kinase (plasmid) [Streptomyces sp. NBC_01351]|uniref:sensor histidine kinase n=1 Tax=Streptomyces sp. NBC_01351 TaxID=2903833 RepID=UPI002E37501B|nr:sensor histidine kinase [Streptomyces sp. NBC_01351]